MFDNLVCPISNTRIDRNVVRTNGLLTTGLLLVYVVTHSPFVIVPVGLDYVLRARMSGPTSPMAHVATLIAKTLRIPYRAMDKAPKVFASRIGVCFAMGAAITHFVAPEVAVWLAGTLALFTTLESVFDFCFGCVVYTYVALPLYRARAAVAALPLFARLEDPMLVDVADGLVGVEFAKGAPVFAEGEAGEAMYVIQSGEVQIFHAAAGGPDRIVASYGAGTHFGEMALLTGQARNASARATEAVRALRLAKSDFERMVQRHPRMRELLASTASERLAAEAALAT